jgi:hypothetical protein
MIHIVGLGGVGFWLAVGLSKVVGATEITCWDDDTLAGGLGANRLPWGPEETKKTELLTGYLSMVHAQTMLPKVQERRFTGLLEVAEGDVVVDCTDMDITPRRRMWTIVRNKKAKLLRVSYDGRGSRVIVSTGLPLYAPEKGGYAAVPSFALSLAAGGLGAEAVARYLQQPNDSFTMSVSVEEGMTT